MPTSRPITLVLFFSGVVYLPHMSLKNCSFDFFFLHLARSLLRKHRVSKLPNFFSSLNAPTFSTINVHKCALIGRRNTAQFAWFTSTLIQTPTISCLEKRLLTVRPLIFYELDKQSPTTPNWHFISPSHSICAFC